MDEIVRQARLSAKTSSAGSDSTRCRQVADLQVLRVWLGGRDDFRNWLLTAA